MRPNRSPLGMVVLMIVMVLLGQACGRKDDPMPPRAKLATITDLTSHSVQEGIVLGWSLTGPAEGIAAFKLLRSETVAGSQTRLTCPQDYRYSVTVPVTDDRLHREGEKKFRYVDANVNVGSSYGYRIAPCDPAGHCGEASNESAVMHALP
jgi:hypothetical protein